MRSRYKSVKVSQQETLIWYYITLAQVLMSSKDASNEEPAADTIYQKKLSNISISITFQVFSFSQWFTRR